MGFHFPPILKKAAAAETQHWKWVKETGEGERDPHKNTRWRSAEINLFWFENAHPHVHDILQRQKLKQQILRDCLRPQDKNESSDNKYWMGKWVMVVVVVVVFIIKRSLKAHFSRRAVVSLPPAGIHGWSHLCLVACVEITGKTKRLPPPLSPS